MDGGGQVRRRWTVGRWVLLGLGVVVVLAVGLVLSFRWRPLWFADQITAYRLWKDGAASRTVVVNGERVHFFDAPATGAADGGRPVLLVHGFGARATEWGALIPRLTAAGFHVYAPDLLGYGDSAKPDIAYSVAEEEAAMQGFLAAEGLQRVDVVGWSMGGWVAMKLAADHPAQVERLVLYDSAGTYFDLHDSGQLFFPETPAELQALFARLTPHRINLPGYVTRNILERMRDSAWIRRRNLRSMLGGRDLMEFRMGEIRQPTLVVWGREDRLIPIAVGRDMAARLPDARFVAVDGCGHLAPSECSGPVAEATIGFLRGAGGAR